jgi:hypothetical protein
MKILTCFLAPTAGTAAVGGHDVFEQSLEVRKKIGYLPEDTPLYRDMLVHEYLEFIADLRGIDRQSLSCMPDCQPRVTLGDSDRYFKPAIDQAGSLSGQANGAAASSKPAN